MRRVSNSSEYQRWAERARERKLNPVDFTRFNPRIRRWRESEHECVKWICTGEGPSGDAIGFGATPGESYEAWTKYEESHIPF